jgi:stage II sporulation protein D
VSSENAPLSITDWNVKAGREPVVRVGVFLEEDERNSVTLRTPEEGYELQVEGNAPARIPPATDLTVTVAAARLRVTGFAEERHGPRVRILPPAGQVLAAGRGILVRDIVAGRGFHWQKHVDQTFTGVIEVVPYGRGLVLVNELPLEEYLAGVITAEMSGACPLDLLKAQCLVARAWLLAMSEPKHEGQPFDRCNDDCCQRYQGTGDLTQMGMDAAAQTRGEILLTPGGDVLDANYAKVCGGVSEEPRHVWGFDKPGLSAVVDAPPGDPAHDFLPVTEENFDAYLDGSWVSSTRCYCSPQVVSMADIGRYLGRVDVVDAYFRWTVNYTQRELAALLRKYLPDAAELDVVQDLRVTQRGVSGRASHLEIDWQDAAGKPRTTTLDSEYRIRRALSRKFLYSSAFRIDTQRDQDGLLSTITLRGAGWGHGAGLCQVGALGMALEGIDYRTICQHYYPEGRLERLYE